MHPILTKIGPVYVYSYGLMVAVGFAVATLLAYRHAGEYGLDRDKIIDFGIMSLIGGVVGGRALYVALNLRYYIANPLEIVNLTKGGLVWYGAFICGLLIAIWFVRKNKIDFWNASDLYAPLSGEVVAANGELADTPDKVNQDPYAAWMFRIKPDSPADTRYISTSSWTTAIRINCSSYIQSSRINHNISSIRSIP